MSLCPHGYTAFWDCPECPEPVGTRKVAKTFCLCCHAEESHVQGWECLECNCIAYEFDPFLEAGPDGKPHTTREISPEEREPLRLMIDEPPKEPWSSKPIICSMCRRPLESRPDDGTNWHEHAAE